MLCRHKRLMPSEATSLDVDTPTFLPMQEFLSAKVVPTFYCIGKSENSCSACKVISSPINIEFHFNFIDNLTCELNNLKC